MFNIFSMSRVFVQCHLIGPAVPVRFTNVEGLILLHNTRALAQDLEFMMSNIDHNTPWDISFTFGMNLIGDRTIRATDRWSWRRKTWSSSSIVSTIWPKHSKTWPSQSKNIFTKFRNKNAAGALEARAGVSDAVFSSGMRSAPEAGPSSATVWSDRRSQGSGGLSGIWVWSVIPGIQRHFPSTPMVEP